MVNRGIRRFTGRLYDKFEDAYKTAKFIKERVKVKSK